MACVLFAAGCSSDVNPGGGGVSSGNVVLNDPLASVPLFPPDNW
jgi:hypothetical protein